MKRVMCIGGLVAALSLLMATGIQAVVLPDNVIISEIMWDGGDYPGGGQYGEYIELHNPTSEDIDLNGWKISIYDSSGSRTNNITFFEDTIQAHGYYLIIDESEFVTSGPYDNVVSFILDNDGGDIILKDESGNFVDGTARLQTELGGRWHAGENTSTGRSMERKDYASDGDLPSAWGSCSPSCEKYDRNGTPRLRNSKIPVIYLDGVSSPEYAYTLAEGEELLIIMLREQLDYGHYVSEIDVDMEIHPEGTAPRSQFSASNYTGQDEGEVLYSAFLEETSLGEYTEEFVLVVSYRGWRNYARLDITAEQFSGSSGGMALVYYLMDQICPWESLAGDLISREVSHKTASTLDDMKRIMYDIRDRMTADMASRAKAASGPFMLLLQKYDCLRERMLKILPRVLECAADRNKVLPEGLRKEVLEVADIVERSVMAEKIASPDLTDLLLQIRVAADASAKRGNARGFIYVPDDYPTIQEAIDAAEERDTVFVRPGTYYLEWPNPIYIDKNRLTLRGVSPANTTIRYPAGYGGTIIELYSCKHVKIRNLRLSSSIGVYARWSDFEVTNCVIDDFCRNGVQIYRHEGDNANVKLINNTFAARRQCYLISRAVQAIDAEVLFVNNIITNCKWGVYLYGHGGLEAGSGYNDIWDTEIPYFGADPLPTDISVDPQFRGENYRLGPYSPCIDAGDPDIFDQDLTRSDMGAYGGFHAKRFFHID